MASSRCLINSGARSADAGAGLFGAAEYASVDAFFQARPFAPSPLRHLSALAARLGVGDILVKDESTRFGLDAFKIVGVVYAVDRLLQERPAARNSRLVCGTTGNHGRAVARVARDRGLPATVYVPETTTATRLEAIAREGAQVVTVSGDYDAAVRRAASDADRYGWTIVSDTAWAGYEQIPRWIMLGYTWIVEEASQQCARESPPDVVIVQAGVGGLAGSVVSWFCQRYAERRPYFIVCEPTAAACLLESARAGRPITLAGSLETMMAGLRCATMSPVVWPVIGAIDAFVMVEDKEAARSMRLLARPTAPDAALTAGPSGACGLAALLAILEDDELRLLREVSGIGPRSQVLVINTEGPTDD